MMLVSCPLHCKSEIEWVCSVILGRFLGLEFATTQNDQRGFCLQYEGRKLEMPDLFFSAAARAWLQPTSLPSLPLSMWKIEESGLGGLLVSKPLPVIFGSAGVTFSENMVRLNLDVFGSAFFLLSRYEEAVRRDRDDHDRFPAAASIAYQAGFLDRPLVNEYVEVLWAAMKCLWPGLRRKLWEPRTLISCDVDEPYLCYTRSLFVAAKLAGGHLLKRWSPRDAARTLVNYGASRLGNYRHDPVNTFNWIMDVNEAAGNRVAFYFIVGHSGGAVDGCYSIDERRIRQLMRRIHERGHEIGLHCSYRTYQDAAQTLTEAKLLQGAMEEEGIRQIEIGCRQHYLRWAMSQTARNLDSAGLAYDTTLSFAERPGFRCSTCYEYPLYDVQERSPLQLRERPLVVMECSVIAERYMGLGYSDRALELMQRYKRTCRQFGGDFTLLWHNSHFLVPEDRAFYRTLIEM